MVTWRTGYRRGLVIFLLALSVAVVGCSKRPDKPTNTGEDIVEKYISTNIRMGSLYLQRGQMEFAKEKADKALIASPESSDANNLMALIYWRLKQYSKAKHYFRLAVRYQPDNAQALNNYGAYLCERGKVRKAIRMLDRAAQNPLYRDRALALANAGQCLIKVKKYKQAADYLRRALVLNAKLPKALYQMARLNYRTGNMLMAQRYLERLFKTGASTAPSLLLAIKVANKRRDFRKAKHYARLLQGKFPDSPEAARVRIR